MNIATLFARIGLDTGGSSKKAQSFLDQLKGIKIGLGVASIGVAAFSYGIKKLMDSAIQTSFALKQFNTETGLSIEKLQRWQSVADETNNSGKAVAESIKAIVSNQEKLKLGQGNISGYQLLGIDPRQNAFDILEQLREKTKGLSQGMKKNVLEQMGVSKDLIQVLELSKTKFDALAKGAFIIPKGAVDMIDKARASSKQLGSAINYLKGMIAANLAPSIIKINKQIMIWIRQNKQGLIEGIKKLFDWVTRIIRAIIRTAEAIDKIVRSTIGWKNAMLILLGVFTLMNLPLMTIVAGVILLIAVIEDLYRFSQGKKSLFGIMLKQFPELEKLMKKFTSGIYEGFNDLKTLFELIRDAIDAIIKLTKHDFKGAFKSMKEGLKDFFGSDPKEIFENYIKWMKKNPFMLSLQGIEGLGNLLIEKKQKGNIENNYNTKVDVYTNEKMDEEKLAKKITEKQQKAINQADDELGGE